jgi:hypothetical protein
MVRWLIILVFVGTTACSNISDGRIQDGPRLISEVTIEPLTPAPTRPLTATSTLEPTVPTQPPTLAPVTEVSVIDLVTPTLPPSKTPTLTPTLTSTPVFSPTPLRPTAERIQQQDPILVPTFVYVDSPPTAIAFAPEPNLLSPQGDISIPAPGLVPDSPLAPCSEARWFFTFPVPPDCPPSGAVISDGSFQPFEDGFMIWVGAQDAIYVLYISAGSPRWQVFPDTYTDDIPEYDPAMNANISPYAAWQPRRGFGLVWRTYPDVRDRIGWAKSEYEAAYTVEVQVAADGTVYIAEPLPRGGVFQLLPNGADWNRFR